MLRWNQNFQDAGAYLMNQFTWALCSTMSDANGPAAQSGIKKDTKRAA